MSYTYAGRLFEAVFDANSQLLKNEVFVVYTDPGTTTFATLYTDASKATTVTGAVASDSLGMLELYGVPGTYYVKNVAANITQEIQIFPDLRDTEARFDYTQGSPSSTWTIVHGLNRYPAVIVTDNSGNVVAPANVRYTDTNTVIVTFGSPTSGFAHFA